MIPETSNRGAPMIQNSLATNSDFLPFSKYENLLPTNKIYIDLQNTLSQPNQTLNIYEMLRDVDS